MQCLLCYTNLFVPRSVFYERAQALPEERGQQLRHQHQDDGRDPQRDGHLARQEPPAPAQQGMIWNSIKLTQILVIISINIKLIYELIFLQGIILSLYMFLFTLCIWY